MAPLVASMPGRRHGHRRGRVRKSRTPFFFPDPWPKKRHHKRRLINADFLSSLARCLKTNGLIHIATDWTDYATAIVDLIHAEPRLHNLSEEGISPRPTSRPETKYERRGMRLGHQVYDIIARRYP